MGGCKKTEQNEDLAPMRIGGSDSACTSHDFGSNAAAIEAIQNAPTPEISEATAYLGDVLASVSLARSLEVERLWGEIEEEAIPSPVAAAFVELAGVAIGASSAGIAAHLSAELTSRALRPSQEKAAGTFAKSAFKDVIDGRLQAHLEGEVLNKLGDGNDTTSQRKDAFFRPISSALLLGQAEERSVARREGAAALQQEDPNAYIEALTESAAALIDPARSEQRAHTLANWMNTLARHDLGLMEEGSEQSGADLRNAGSGRGLGDKLMGNHPRGLVRVRIRAAGPSQGVEIHSVTIAGLNPDRVAELTELDFAIGQLGLNVHVAGSVYVGDHDASGIEVGIDQTGRLRACDTTGRGGHWLETYGFDTTGAFDMQSGATALATRAVLEKRFAELPTPTHG